LLFVVDERELARHRPVTELTESALQSGPESLSGAQQPTMRFCNAERGSILPVRHDEWLTARYETSLDRAEEGA